MSISYVPTPTSRCRFGIGRCDITPPIGIYHRFWGAASHDQATGVHQNLTATVLWLGDMDAGAETEARGQVVVALDHCLFRPDEMDELLGRTSELINVAPSRLLFAFSHTHSAGYHSRDRGHLPGGELIGPYLDGLPEKIAAAYREAVASIQPATFTYASTSCAMGHQRDYWDAQRKQYVCGFNPEHSGDLPLHVVRVSDEHGGLLATIVNYPCHPTTLAWQNTLISPDYVGELRKTVEQATGAPCTFLLAPCGDIGPRYGFVGETATAERNGRQVGYAALSALESMPIAATDFHYTGPVLSGATLGTWELRPLSPERQQQVAVRQQRSWHVDLPYLPDLPTADQARRELQDLAAQEAAALDRDDRSAAREFRALAERKRRLLERIRPLPAGSQYPFPLHLWRFGDAYWVAIEGEPYHWLQQHLQQIFPELTIIVIAIANGARCSYLPTRADYDKPLYQVDVALLAPGCLEKIAASIVEEVRSMREDR
jgi:hypothetical protein